MIMNHIRIEYFGHSCFRLSGREGQRVVLDPYSDGSVPGLSPLRVEAEYVYCSHQHSDHNAVECVQLSQGERMPEFQVTEVLTDHDNTGGSQRGKNIIRIFDFHGLRVAHFGDLGRMLTAEEIKTLSGLDAVLIPVGGFYTIDAQQAKSVIDEILPRVAILMHFRTDHSGYEVISHLDEVVRAMGDVVFSGDTLVLDNDTPRQIAILDPVGAR